MNREATSIERILRIVLPVAAVLSLATCGGGGGAMEERLGEILANETDPPEQLITKLEAFLEDEPPLELASEARFTIGWIYAETLKQYPEARRWFQALLDQAPSGPWSEEAAWMLENMEKADSDLLPGLGEPARPSEAGPAPAVPPPGP